VGARLLGGAGYDAGVDVAVADDGSVYLLGWTRSRAFRGRPVRGETDLVVARYGPKGVLKWVRLLGGDRDEDAGGIALGPDGSVYVSGQTFSPSVGGVTSNGESDAILAKYTPEGGREWVRLFGTAKADGARDVAVDEGGALYVTGTISGAGFGDLMLARFKDDGTREWLNRRSGDGYDAGSSVIAGAGAVFVAGDTDSERFMGHKNVAGDTDAVLAAFTSEGKRSWARFYGTDLIDRFDAVGFGQGGDALYVTGYADTPLCCGAPSNFGDLAVARYLTNGKRTWVDRRGTDDALDSGHGIAPSANGGAYVVGSWNVRPFDTGDSKAFLFEYSTARAVTARRFVGSPTQDGASAVAVGPDGSIWVVGWTAGPIGKQKTAGEHDIVLYRFKPAPGG
jgi:hypothetical protein